jgi:hypothetical protein
MHHERRVYRIAESAFRLLTIFGTISPVRFGRKATLTADQKQELAELILRLAKLFFDITPREFGRLAYY